MSLEDLCLLLPKFTQVMREEAVGRKRRKKLSHKIIELEIFMDTTQDLYGLPLLQIGFFCVCACVCMHCEFVILNWLRVNAIYGM